MNCFKKLSIIKKMNHRLKKFLHLIIVECKVNRQKLVDMWDKSANITVKSKYNLYVKDNYKALKQQFPEESRAEIMKRLRTQWSELSDVDKAKYMVIEEKKPKVPNAYQNFFKQNYPNIKHEHSEWRLPEISKNISAKWKALNEEEKSLYKTSTNEKYEKIKSAHNQALVVETQQVIPCDTVIDFVEPLKHDRDDDIYLSTEEKTEIEDTIHNVFANKALETICKLVKDNYNVNIPCNTPKNDVLEKVYQIERESKIKNNLEEKKKLVPAKSLQLNKTESSMLDEKRESLEKMEYWTLYLQFRNYFPEEEDEELPAEELVEKIIDKERLDMLYGKICEAMKINP